MTSATSWQNPDPRGRYHLLIVGAGPAGLIAAQTARRRGASVALIERNRLGGTCLNRKTAESRTTAEPNANLIVCERIDRHPSSDSSESSVGSFPANETMSSCAN